ncbi:PREDICTED: macrophage mannose receptor 1-like [Priapulus caudatus]|uniref:Macrophage mannose receptor 1-like n=1 Tax=Priapulus caudatus TaxID=37621 RepID=A0ABM1ECW0_PRICU|nr:PREDICTED: macrophage mannose receptor 1-like [Priapulus caudatus]
MHSVMIIPLPAVIVIVAAVTAVASGAQWTPAPDDGAQSMQTIHVNCDCDKTGPCPAAAPPQSSTSSSSPPPRCPDEFISVNNSCYRFHSLPTTWRVARDVCHYYGAELAAVETREENAFLHSRFYEEFVRKREYDTSTDAHYFWVGGTDERHEGYWAWAGSGEPIHFELWASDQPAAGSRDQNYLCIDLWTGLWHDHLNTRPLGYVCEMAATLPPL